jgi:hypothetical protein
MSARNTAERFTGPTIRHVLELIGNKGATGFKCSNDIDSQLLLVRGNECDASSLVSGSSRPSSSMDIVLHMIRGVVVLSSAQTTRVTAPHSQ